MPEDYDGTHCNMRENSMSMQSEGKDAKGRNYDQVTKDGTTSAGSYGAGSTGDAGSMGAAAGGEQRDTRTDDLLTSGSDQELNGGFVPAELAGELQTGLGGIGSLATGNAGNRQSEGESQPGGTQDAMNSNAGSGAAGAPEAGGQRIQK
jgi:hypothetical protein